MPEVGNLVGSGPHVGASMRRHVGVQDWIFSGAPLHIFFDIEVDVDLLRIAGLAGAA